MIHFQASIFNCFLKNKIDIQSPANDNALSNTPQNKIRKLDRSCDKGISDDSDDDEMLAEREANVQSIISSNCSRDSDTGNSDIPNDNETLEEHKTNVLPSISHRSSDPPAVKHGIDGMRKTGEMYVNNENIHICNNGPLKHTDIDSLNSKISEILDATKKIQHSVELLDKKSMLQVPKTDEGKPNVPPVILMQCDNVLANLTNTRSIGEIVELGFAYNNSCFTCDLCKSDFLYHSEDGIEFEKDQKLPKSFSNLKSHIKKHILSHSHVNKQHEKVLEETSSEKSKTRLHDIGMKVGRVAYNVCFSGMSFQSFETQILLQNLNGVDIGDINHSKDFVKKLLPEFAKHIKGRVKKFITTTLPQTGHLPAVNTAADKATYKHRSRQFVSLTTIVPDSPGLIQMIFVGIPVVKHGSTGLALCQNWKSALDDIQVIFIAKEPRQIFF